MWGKYLSRKNSDFLDSFIQLVEKKSFGSYSNTDNVWADIHNPKKHYHNEEENRLFLKYKLCLCQPFKVTEFFGNKNIKREFAIIQFIESEQDKKLNCKPMTKATLIRAFNNDYKLIFEDKGFYSITNKMTKRRFYFPGTKNSKRLQTSQDSWPQNSVNVVKREEEEDFNDIKVIFPLSDSPSSPLSQDCNDLHRVRTDESADSIVFLSTGNSTTKEIKDKKGITSENMFTLSPDSTDSNSLI